MRTLIIQSSSDTQRQGWIGSCIASVESWAAGQGYHYRFVGDEIFDLVPRWYRDKVDRRFAIATDYARLVLLQRALDEGYQQALWFDADVLIFDASLRLDFSGTCAFGQEVWVQQHEGRLQARRNVHNAVCGFRQQCPVLPFLAHTTLSLISRVDRDRIAPQMVGPKLLNALHSLCDFALLPGAGALSPAVVHDLCAGGGPALALLRQQSAVTVKAVNVCASLADDTEAAQAVSTLLARGGL